MMKIKPNHIPNIITSIRLVLTAPIVWALLQQRIPLACSLFFIAALTDWLDGFLARRYEGWATELGSFLDPLTDKVLLVSLFITYAYLNYLPTYVIVIAVGRDLLMVSGILLYQLMIGSLNYSPLYSSKVNTALQLSLILFVLLQKILWIPTSVVTINSIMMAITSCMSFIQYAKIGFLKVRHHVKKTQ